MLCKLISAFLVVILSAYISPATAQNLTIYTTELPPFSYIEGRNISGLSTEVVKRALESAGINYTIEILPWEQAYKSVQEKPNTMIYSITRSKERENLFKWVGMLTLVTYSVQALQSRKDIKIEKLSDMKNYNIGTVNDDITESYLKSKGFSASDFDRISGQNAAAVNFAKLLNNQIDVWPIADPVAYYLVRQKGHPKPSLVIRNAFPLEEVSGGYYLAANKNTPDDVVRRVTIALKKFKQTKDYYKTLAHWGVYTMYLTSSEAFPKLLYSLKYFKRITKVGYLASDELAAHQDGGLYRKELREVFVEKYVKTFDQWREKFIEMQDQVDVLIIGSTDRIKGWKPTRAKNIILESSRVPTGSLKKDLADITFLGYANNSLVINVPVAKKLDISIPKSFLRTADKVIQ